MADPDKQLDADIRAAQVIYRHKSRAARAIQRITASDLTAPKYVPDDWPDWLARALGDMRHAIERIPHFRPQDHDLADQISEELDQVACNITKLHADALGFEDPSEGWE
uniref:Uncharacterized protein n=1 Tax=Dulem virus 32 TaxID=3145750 RepID=A0AAU8B0I6_9CAUD